MHKYLIQTAVSAAIAVSAQSAWAQSAADSSDRMRALETIFVTAQRTEETLQDAALPVNAASGEDLERMGVADASGLNKVTPSLYVSTGGGANTAYFVRGVGNFTNNGYTAPAIAFHIDGVYIGRPSSTISSFLDLNRVEVLKGPQGTLYGRNATGGAINVIPNTPVIGEDSFELSLGAGNFGQRNAGFTANLSTGDDSALRFAGVIAEHDGYFDDGTSDADDTALRLQYANQASDSFDFRLTADYSKQEGKGPGNSVDGLYTFAPFQGSLPVPNWAFVPFGGDEFGGLHRPDTLQFIEANATAAPLFSPLNGYAYPFRDDTYWGVNAEFNFDTAAGTLSILPAYRHSELDNQFNGPPFKAAINQDEADQSSLEVRLVGSSGDIDYILGAYYFDESVEGVNSFNQFSTVTYNDFKSDVESTALYARATFNLSDVTRLVGGIRFTDEQRAFDTRVISLAAVCLIEPVAGPPSCAQVPTVPVGLTAADSINALDPSLLTGPPAAALIGMVNNSPDGVPVVTPYGPFGMMGPQAILSFTPTEVDLEAGDEEITYRLAIEHDLSADSLLYASFETGFRAGGFNQAFAQETYDPEFIDAFTIGSKNRFFDNTFELNAELFLWKYEDQQLAALGLDGRGNNSFYTRNVGESTIQGIEVDFQYALTVDTLVRGSVQLLDSVYDTYSYTQVDLSDDTDPPNFLTPVTGCATTQLGVDGNPATPREFVIDCSGKDSLNSPELSANLGIQQHWATSDFEITGSIDARYRGDREVGFNYVPGGRADSVLTADAALTLSPMDRAWSLTAYVRNLTDEVVPTTYQVGAGNVASSALEPPRTYGVNFKYNF